MLTDLQFIVFRRETIELIAVRQLTGKCREVVFSAVTSISLEPGEDFAHRLDWQVGQQTRYPRTGADQQFLAAVAAVGGVDCHAIRVMVYGGNRAIKQLSAARLARETYPGFDGQLAA